MDPFRSKYPCLLMLLFVAAMSSCAVLLNEPEIFFPEAAALCIGAWVAPRQPWRVTRIQMVVLMTASAVGGVAIVRWLDLPLTVQTAFGLAYTAALLTLSGSTLIPLVSACILPIFLRTESWVYPLSVCLLTVCIAGIQLLLTRFGLRTDATPGPVPALKTRVRHWGLTMLAMFLFCLLPTWLGRVYFCAPPLLVTFAELLFPHSPLRQKPLRVWCLCTGAACIGLGVRLLNLRLGVPAVVCAVLSALLVLILFRSVKQMLPPAAAAALLPILLPAEGILLYVPLLAAGAAVVTAVPHIYYSRVKCTGHVS